ncbi:MAG: class I SAM-dependent methyltransferase [Candidatus Delongbacteria bacterium]
MKDDQTFCEFCGPKYEGKFYGKGKEYTVLRCPRCKLLWSQPLTDENYRRMNNTGYFGEEIYISKEKAQKERFRIQINKTLDIYKRYVNNDNIKILDVGSGLGFFLNVCSDLGIYSEGCDINKKAVDHANRMNNKTRLGTVDGHYNDNSFDMIFALNLIEHIPHPKKFVQECKRILKPHGLLIIETPIQESLFHIFARIGDFLTGFRMNNYGINTNGHIYKFCNRTFEEFSSLGFRPVHKEKIGSPLKEIYGKISYMSKRNRVTLKLFLPVLWTLAKITGMENRIFIVFRSTNNAEKK